MDFDSAWKRVVTTVRKLLNQEKVKPAEWQDLVSTNNRISSWVHNGSERLLNAFEEELTTHGINAAKRIHSYVSGDDLLRAYAREWKHYSFLLEYLPAPFVYMKRKSPGVHIGIRYGQGMDTETFTGVRHVMYAMWDEHVFKTVQTRFLNAAKWLLTRERLGEGVEADLFDGIRQSFVNREDKREDPLAMYGNDFERGYIKRAEEFYSTDSQQVLSQSGVVAYMSYAYQIIKEEEIRARLYKDFTNRNSFFDLVKAVVIILVVKHQEWLLAEALHLFTSQDSEQLNQLFYLMKKTTNGIDPLMNVLAKPLQTEGLETLRQNAETIVQDCEKYIAQLLDVYTRFSTLVLNATGNDTRFLMVRDLAFREIVNNTDIFRIQISNEKGKSKNTQPPEFKFPELLANYCDLLLRKSTLTKNLSSDEIDEKLSNVLLVLKYVSNKDVFMRYHKTHLSRRLILELSADQEKEEVLVNKFRENGMPSDVVSKLFRMLQDVEFNKELSAEFRQYCAEKGGKSIADVIHLKILNAGAWSRGRNKCHVSFSPEIEEIIPEVEEFYKKKYTGRKLNWCHNWSSAVVTFVSNKGKYEVEVSAFQMAVLFCYNDLPHEKRSLESLRVATELPDADLIRTLLSLVMNPKTKVQLMKTDCEPINPKNFKESTLFWIHHDFAIVKGEKTQPRGRITLVNRIVMNQESIEDEAHDEIMRLRELRIQEGIVKLMKTHRTMKQNVLHNELVDLLRYMFTPTRRLIKQQLEWLTERNFIKRDNHDIETLVYVG